MTNNDVLRRLRYALRLPDALSEKIWTLGGRPVSANDVVCWTARDDDAQFRACSDADLTAFLDGFIVLRRGPRPAGAPVPTPERLTNNVILKKLRVALAWQEADMLAALRAGGVELSASELSSLFRKAGQRNFQPCGDQVLRAFLAGLATLPPDSPR